MYALALRIYIFVVNKAFLTNKNLKDYMKKINYESNILLLVCISTAHY